MPKRSRIDQLDLAVEALLAHPQDALPPAEASVAELLTLAADLRELPREDFRAQLKSDLERKAAMTTKTVQPIREGFHTLTPYLVVQGVARLIDFVKQAFAAEEVFRAPRLDGTIQHAELRIGDSRVEMGDAPAEHPPMPAALHLYLEDADAAYQRALAAGAASLYAPMDQDYGDREAGVRDPLGNVWYIATHKGAQPVPEGLRSVTPFLHPRGTAQLIDFLKEAFGAVEDLRVPAPDGAILYARLTIGNSALELGEAHGQFQPMPSTLHLRVEDSDAVYQRALNAGATSILAPVDQPYGERMAGVRDSWGNHWYIATPIEDVSP